MRGYINANSGTALQMVGQYLGSISLTADQIALATQYLDSVESFIDARTGRVNRRSWLQPAQTNELHRLERNHLALNYAPVTSIAQIQQRTTQVGDTWTTLTAGTEYEMIDTTRGIVQFVAGHRGFHTLVQVSYTPNSPVPAEITEAALMIVSTSLLRSIKADRLDLSELQLDR